MIAEAVGLTWRDPFWYCVVGAIASVVWVTYTFTRPLAYIQSATSVWLQSILMGTSFGSLAAFGVKALL